MGEPDNNDIVDEYLSGSLPEEWWSWADDRLGQDLWVRWAHHSVKRRGYDLRQVSDETIENLAAATREIDDATINNSELEKILRHAARGDFVTAGRLFRDLVGKLAQLGRLQELADFGISIRDQRADLARTGTASRKKASEQERQRWQDIDTQSQTESDRPNQSLSSKIARARRVAKRELLGFGLRDSDRTDAQKKLRSQPEEVQNAAVARLTERIRKALI